MREAMMFSICDLERIAIENIQWRNQATVINVLDADGIQKREGGSLPLKLPRKEHQCALSRRS